MNLLQFLRTKSVNALQRVYAFWSGEADTSFSKRAMTDKLHPLMSQSELVARKFGALPAAGRLAVEYVFFCPGRVAARAWVEQYIDALFPAGAIDAAETVGGLTDTGFLHEADGILCFADEIASSVDNLLSEHRPPGRKATVDAAVFADEFAGLCDVAPARLVEEYGMLIPLGGLTARRPPDDTAAYSALLAAAQAGRLLQPDVEALDFKPLGPCILFRVDFVRALFPDAKVWRDEFHSLDLLTDLETIIHYTSHNLVRITQDGEIYKAHRKFLFKSLCQSAGLAGSREHLLDFKIRFLLYAGYIEEKDDGRIIPTKKVRTWARCSLKEKTAQLISFVAANLNQKFPNCHAVEEIFMRAVERVSLLDPDRPVPYAEFMLAAQIASLEMLTSCRRTYPRQPLLYHETLGEIQEEFFSCLLGIGFLKVGLSKDGAPVAVSLTELGGRMLGRATSSAHGHQSRLIVNPDFEIVLIPGDDLPDLLHNLAAFAKPGKRDFTHHFHISRESIQQALVGGMRCADIAKFLNRYSGGKVPQNVEFSISQWAENTSQIRIEPLVLLEADSSETLNRILLIPEISEIFERKISDRAAALTEVPRSQKLLAALRRMNVYIGT